MNEFDKKVWIWLTEALGYDNAVYKSIFEIYGENISDFYYGGEKEWRMCGLLSNSSLSKLACKSISTSEKIVDRCEKISCDIITLGDKNYPNKLLNIYSPPAVLYFQGDLSEIDDVFSLGIVGTRRASRYGIQSAYTISHDMAKSGAIIVSGGAVGIDGASHRGALDANGRTICVLGCGIDINYPKDNYMMRKSIVK
ncbi:MAG: DNA-processing protein DprA, partial [Acutalibacteraceae bacterium]